MEELQSKLTSAPVLELPRLNGKFNFDTYAFERKVGCLLLKEQPDGMTKPVGYWLRSLNKAER